MMFPHHTFTLLVTLIATSSAFGKWENLTSLPLPNAGFAAGWVGNRLLIAGGTHWQGDKKIWLDKTWRYDPSSDGWESGPDLPHPIAYAAHGCDGENLFLAGGGDGTRAKSEVYALDSSLNARTLPSLSQPVAYAGGTFNRGRFWMAGGTADPDDWNKTNRLILSWIPKDGFSSPATPLPSPQGLGLPCLTGTLQGVYGFTGAWLDPKDQQIKNLDIAFVIENETSTARPLPPYPKAARGVAVVALNETHLYLAGGYGSDAEGFLAESWIFDTRTEKYTPSIPLPLRALTCLVKGGGHIYVCGGENRKKHRTDAFWRISIRSLLP